MIRAMAGSTADMLSLPDDLRHDFDALKRRSYVWICGIFSAVGILLMIVHIWALGDAAWATVVIAIPCQIVFVGSLLVLHRTGSVSRAAWTAVFALIAGVFSLAFMQGGLLSHAAPILLVGPSMAAFFLSVRATVLFSVVCALFLIALYQMRGLAWVDETLLLTGDLRALVTAIVLVSVLLCIGLINALFLRANMQIQTRLTEASMEAKRANAAKDRFVSTLSHEIRTPLNGVAGMSQLLLQSDLSPEQERWARMISDSTRNLTAILDDVLDASRLGTGTFEIVDAPFDLADLCISTREMVDVLAGDKGLAIGVEVEPGLSPRYIGDVARIRQILLNLLGNAVKFTDQGSVELRVRKDRNGLAFSVSDTGPGIAPEDQERIFERFHQSRGAAGHKRGGTGLGLAISRDLAHLMGGEITVESAPGAGSVFTFTAPLTPDE